jgi:opacity protein-like surface antigen
MARGFRTLCAAALLPLAAQAQAQAQDIDYGSIDGFFVPHARAHWPPAFSADDRGNGGGVRVLSRATDWLMVLGEYQYLSYGDPDATTGQYRVGAGLALPSTSGFYLTYDHLDLDAENAIAFGLHGRLAGKLQDPVSLYASAGYLATDGSSFYYDGFEFNLGLTWDLPEPWGMFADYRATLLDDRDSDARLHRQEYRVGIRFRFDC